MKNKIRILSSIFALSVLSIGLNSNQIINNDNNNTSEYIVQNVSENNDIYNLDPADVDSNKLTFSWVNSNLNIPNPNISNPEIDALEEPVLSNTITLSENIDINNQYEFEVIVKDEYGQESNLILSNIVFDPINLEYIYSVTDQTVTDAISSSNTTLVSYDITFKIDPLSNGSNNIMNISLSNIVSGSGTASIAYQTSFALMKVSKSVVYRYSNDPENDLVTTVAYNDLGKEGDLIFDYSSWNSKVDKNEIINVGINDTDGNSIYLYDENNSDWNDDGSKIIVPIDEYIVANSTNSNLFIPFITVNGIDSNDWNLNTTYDVGSSIQWENFVDPNDLSVVISDDSTGDPTIKINLEPFAKSNSTFSYIELSGDNLATKDITSEFEQGDSIYIYNYTGQDLVDGSTYTLTLGYIDGTQPKTKSITFDYDLNSINDSPNTSSVLSTGAIVGITIGSITLIFLILALAYFYKKKRSN